MKIIINKFGGGILGDAKAIRHLPEVFKMHITENSINVFSAFGKTTNNLERIVNTYTSGDMLESNKTLNELRLFHLGIALDLFPDGHIVFHSISDITKKISDTLLKIGKSADEKYVYDQIVPYGEILASLIISHYFATNGIHNKLVYATDCIKTDLNFRSAHVDKNVTEKNLKSHITSEVFKTHKHIITQGFIGFSYLEDGEKCMTTLGREGSDYTAGLLGNLMNAEKVVLWKDVPGVMEKNPKLPGNEHVKKIDTISYDEFENLLQSEAIGLVHPKTLHEVREKNIPLQVRPFWDLGSEGTLISQNI